MRPTVWIRVVVLVLLLGWCVGGSCDSEDELESTDATAPAAESAEHPGKVFGDQRYREKLPALETAVRSLRSSLDGAERGLDDLPQVFRNESDRRELESWCGSWEFQMDNIPAPPEMDRNDPRALRSAIVNFESAHEAARGICARSRSLPSQFDVYRRLMRARGRTATAENHLDIAIKMAPEDWRRGSR